MASSLHLRWFALITAGAACTLPASPAAADDEGIRDCDRLFIPVTLAPTDATSYRVAAWVCGHHDDHGDAVQLLLHGSTYSHLYWDFPVGERDSYVRAANQRGFVTVNVDRIGIGESDHPPAGEVTVESNAFVAHQIIAALRAGSIAPDDRPLHARRVVLVGHSLGSSIAAFEAATYADVDGVILSGYLHNEGPGDLTFGSAFYPASLDPETSSAPPGYFTTIPGTRGMYFYSTSDADPAVIAEDEATKQTVTFGELSTFMDGFGPTLSIHVPVLVAVGDEDALFCDAPSCTAAGTLDRERAFYAPDAHLETFALPNAGHSMNLHLNAGRWFDVAADWIHRRVH